MNTFHLQVNQVELLAAILRELGRQAGKEGHTLMTSIPALNVTIAAADTIVAAYAVPVYPQEEEPP